MTKYQKGWVAALFLCSGATGLIYETLWIRVLSSGVCSTSQSMSIVLSLFFLGLSLGSYLGGKQVLHFKRPLLLYGFLELGVGFTALLLFFPLVEISSYNFSWKAGLLSELSLFLKFGLVGVLLFLPTVCMGAMFPLVVRVFYESRNPEGREVSRLYALNTLGAVLGAFSTGFWLIPRWGVMGANYFAVLLSLVVGAIAVQWGKKFEVKLESPRLEPEAVLFSRKHWALIVTFLCGFVSIGFEVLSNKYLNAFFGTENYGIGLTLALFLAGISLGAWLLSLVIPSIQNRAKFLVQLLGTTVLFLFVSSLLLLQASDIATFLHSTIGEAIPLFFLQTLVVTGILLPPTCLFGALFPLCVLVLGEGKEEAARAAGFAYSMNTVGAILGSYVCGVFLIPLLGSLGTLKVLISLMAGATLLVVLITSDKSRWPFLNKVTRSQVFLSSGEE